MRWVYSRHTYKKIGLVVLAEAVAYVVMKLFSTYVIQISTVSVPYIMFGGVLAYVVVVEYDKCQKRKEKRLRDELRMLSNVTKHEYRRYLESEIGEPLQKKEED